MQRELNFLKNKQVKELLQLINNRWSVELDWGDKYYFLKNFKNKIFIVNKDINKVEFEKLRIDKLGLYVAELKNELRLSIEGSQMIGPFAKKNIIELTEDQMIYWMQGNDLEIKGEYSGFVILKHEEYYLGSGKYSDGVIVNHVPKARRIP